MPDAVPVTLAGAHHDPIRGEVHVFDPEVRAFQQSEARAVEQDRHQPRRAVEVLNDGTDFVPRQHDGKPLRRLGPHDAIEPRQFLLQNVAIEKQQGAQRLVLRGRGHVPVDGGRAEELSQFRGAHFCRVAFAVEQDVSADPCDVGSLRPSASVASSQSGADAFEEPGLTRRGRKGLPQDERRSGRRAVRDSARRPRGHDSEMIVPETAMGKM
jgi:hypothetical protein